MNERILRILAADEDTDPAEGEDEAPPVPQPPASKPKQEKAPKSEKAPEAKDDYLSKLQQLMKGNFTEDALRTTVEALFKEVEKHSAQSNEFSQELDGKILRLQMHMKKNADPARAKKAARRVEYIRGIQEEIKFIDSTRLHITKTVEEQLFTLLPHITDQRVPDIDEFVKARFQNVSTVIKNGLTLDRIDRRASRIAILLSLPSARANLDREELRSSFKELEAIRKKIRAHLNDLVGVERQKRFEHLLALAIESTTAPQEEERSPESDVADKIAAITKKTFKQLQDQLPAIGTVIPADKRIENDLRVTAKRVFDKAEAIRAYASPYKRDDVARTAILSAPALYQAVTIGLTGILNSDQERTAAGFFDRMKKIINPVKEDRQNREKRRNQRSRSDLPQKAEAISNSIQGQLHDVFVYIPDNPKLETAIRKQVQSIAKEINIFAAYGKKKEQEYPDLQYGLTAIATLLNTISAAILKGLQ